MEDTPQRSRGMVRLTTFLSQLPATRVLSTSEDNPDEAMAFAALVQKEGGAVPPPEDPAKWWVKVKLDIRSHLAWHVVQELGSVLNLLSLSTRLTAAFKPVSPPPYMNGGPDDYLSWVIESTIPAPVLAGFLEGRLPQPVSDLRKWSRCGADPCDVPLSRE